eukprot:jgi/Chlat1/8706/Chrsp88S00670
MASRTLLALCVLLFASSTYADLVQTNAKTSGVQSIDFVLEEAPKLRYQGGYIHVQDQGLIGDFGVALTEVVIEPCSIWGPLFIPNAGSLFFVASGSAKIGMTNAFTPFYPELTNTTQLHEEDLLAVPIAWPFWIMNPTSDKLKIIGYHKFSTINPQNQQLQFTYVFGKTFFPNYQPLKEVATTYNVTKARAKAFFNKQRHGGMVNLPTAVCAANPVPPRLVGDGRDGTPQGDFILHCGNPALALVQFAGVGYTRDCSLPNFPETGLIGASLIFPTLQPAIKNGVEIEAAGAASLIPPSYIHQPVAISTEGLTLLSWFNTPEIPAVFFTSAVAIYQKTKTFPADIMAAAFGTSVADYTDFFASNKGSALGLFNQSPK